MKTLLPNINYKYDFKLVFNKFSSILKLTKQFVVKIKKININFFLRYEIMMLNFLIILSYFIL